MCQRGLKINVQRYQFDGVAPSDISYAKTIYKMVLEHTLNEHRFLLNDEPLYCNEFLYVTYLLH
jgi:hypothetical protein